MRLLIMGLFILGLQYPGARAQDLGTSDDSSGVEEALTPIPKLEVKEPKDDSKAPNENTDNTKSSTNVEPALPSKIEEPKPASKVITPKSSPQQQAAKAGKGLGRLADLKLSPDQTAAMIEAKKQWNPELEKALREDVRSAKEDLANAMVDGSSSEDVRRKFLYLQKKYSELQTLKFEKSLKIREILNLDQRKKFQEIRTKAQLDP